MGCLSTTTRRVSLARAARVAPVLSAVLAAMMGTTARADMVVVFDNFKPNLGAATFDGQRMNPIVLPSRTQVERDYANAFTPTQSGFVSDVWGAFTISSGAVNQIDLWLATDDNGQPGNTLEMYSLTNAMPLRGAQFNALHFDASDSAFIEAGRQYWLVSSTPFPSIAQWMYNATGDTGPVKMRTNGGPWTATDANQFSGYRGAFRVAVVPEPATIALLVIGGAAFLRRRFGKV